MKFKKLKEEYEYLFKNKLRTWDDIETRRVGCILNLQILKEEKQDLKEKAPKYYKMKQLLEGRNAFGDIEEDFRLMPDGTIGTSRFTEAESKEYIAEYEMTRSDIKKRSAEARKELAVISRIEEKHALASAKELYQEEEKEKEKPDGRNRENGMEPGTERSH